MSNDLRTLDYWPSVVPGSHIKAHLKQFVQGQDKAIDLLAYIGNLYSLQLLALKHGIRKKSMPKLNCLLTAPTGCGKTFLVSKFAEALGLPYQKVDCSSVRAEGWHGTNLSEYIYRFLQQSPYGFGVLHLDEMDKLAITGGNNTEGKLDLQMGLLDILDGDYKHLYDRWGKSGTIDLSSANNCLVIMSGSFQTIRNFDEDFDDQCVEHEEEIADAEEKIAEEFESDDLVIRQIGFSADFNKVTEISRSKKKERQVRRIERAKKKLAKRKDELGSDKSWKERMKKLGFIQELASRIVWQEELEGYDKVQLKKILVEGKESAYNKYLNLIGQHHSLQEEEIDAIIDEIHGSENGLRDMESILFRKFYEKSQ